VNAEIPNIWQLQARRDVAGLSEALTHSDAAVRTRAATALRILDAIESLPVLEAALVVEDDWEAQASIRETIKHLTRDDRLQELIDTRNIDGLLNMLYSPRLEDVLGAAEALGRLGDRSTVEALVALFRDPAMPDDGKYAVAKALIQLKSAPAIVALLAGLQRDEWQVRRNSAAVLGQLEATWAARGLIEALEDANLTVRRTALAALRRLGTPIALQAVAEFESRAESGDADGEVHPPAEP
jgi:HEAT repeat protein